MQIRDDGRHDQLSIPKIMSPAYLRITSSWNITTPTHITTQVSASCQQRLITSGHSPPPRPIKADVSSYQTHVHLITEQTWRGAIISHQHWRLTRVINRIHHVGGTLVVWTFFSLRLDAYSPGPNETWWKDFLNLSLQIMKILNIGMFAIILKSERPNDITSYFVRSSVKYGCGES